MKYLSFAFAMLALAAAIAAVWRQDLFWQCAATCLLFIIAAAGFAGRQQACK